MISIIMLKNEKHKNKRERGKIKFKQPTLTEAFKTSVLLFLMCICVPIIYIRAFSLIIGLSQLTITELLTDSMYLWK